jgi:hypothetical protein
MAEKGKMAQPNNINMAYQSLREKTTLSSGGRRENCDGYIRIQVITPFFELKIKVYSFSNK